MPKSIRQRGTRPGRHHLGTPGDIISECLATSSESARRRAESTRNGGRRGRMTVAGPLGSPNQSPDSAPRTRKSSVRQSCESLRRLPPEVAGLQQPHRIRGSCLLATFRPTECLIGSASYGSACGPARLIIPHATVGLLHDGLWGRGHASFVVLTCPVSEARSLAHPRCLVSVPNRVLVANPANTGNGAVPSKC